ncbi:hypothetical protein JCM3770_003414 [Rhodotorula araucariae]
MFVPAIAPLSAWIRSLMRFTVLVALAGIVAPTLAVPSRSPARLHARDDSLVDDAWTTLKDLGSAAFACPSDCGSYLVAAARCSLQIVQNLSVSRGLECFCTEIPSDLDQCSACVAEDDAGNSFADGMSGAGDLVDKACSFLGVGTSSGLSSASSTASISSRSSSSSSSAHMRVTTLVAGGQSIIAWVPDRASSSSSSSAPAGATLAASSPSPLPQSSLVLPPSIVRVTVTASPTGPAAAGAASGSPASAVEAAAAPARQGSSSIVVDAVRWAL